MIIRYDSYVNNKSSCGFSVLIDNIQKKLVSTISRPVEINDSYTQRMWDTIDFFIKNPQITSLDGNCSTDGEKTLNNEDLQYLSQDMLNVRLLEIGHECLQKEDFEKRKVSFVDNIDYRFFNKEKAITINCVNLIKENEIISILTNGVMYIMNDNGQTIEIIRP